jgi:magnesium transporter
VTDTRRRMLPGLGLLARLRQSDDPGPAPRRENPHAVVDCAVYAQGRRQPGRRHFADAYTAARRRRGAFVWLGLHEPDAALMAEVGRVFGLHALTVEQALTDGHRPTVERHGDLTLLVLRTARYVEHDALTATSEVVDTGDVMILIGERFVVTVRHGAAGALADVRAGLERRPPMLILGPWAVAHTVCAQMVQLYLDVAAHVETDLEGLEETTFARDGRLDMQHIYQLKREVVEFKRAVLPLQAPLRDLAEDADSPLPADLHPYFTDAAGRLSRAVDRVAGFDELINSIMQAGLAQVAVDQNNDMRKIASWAAIAAAQTAIAGVYGMNFDNMPETHWRYGYFGALALMAASALVLHRLFRRSGWL